MAKQPTSNIVYNIPPSFEGAIVVATKVASENIIQSWGCYLPGQAEKIDQYFELIEDEITKRDNGLDVEYEELGARLGTKTTFLKIPWDDNWCAYYGAEGLGIDLGVTWNLYCKNPLKGMERIGLLVSDFLETNGIKLFASVTLDCAIEAANALVEDTDLDSSRINRESSGAFGPL